MSTTILLSYDGIALVSQTSPTFTINLPFTWSGSIAPRKPVAHSANIDWEVDDSGFSFSESATLAITNVAPSANPFSGFYAITMTASDLDPSTVAVIFSIELNYTLNFNQGDTLTMTYGQVVVNPETGTVLLPVSSPVGVRTSVQSITSNINYPVPSAGTPSTINDAPSKIIPEDTIVTIPINVPTDVNQTYLGVIFVLNLLFGASFVLPENVILID